MLLWHTVQSSREEAVGAQATHSHQPIFLAIRLTLTLVRSDYLDISIYRYKHFDGAVSRHELMVNTASFIPINHNAISALPRINYTLHCHGTSRPPQKYPP